MNPKKNPRHLGYDCIRSFFWESQNPVNKPCSLGGSTFEGFAINSRCFFALFLLVLAVLILGFFPGVFAQIPEDIDVSGISNLGELSDVTLTKDFLITYWSTMMQNSSTGEFLESVREVIEPANPVLELILGVEFAWSFFFFLALVLWIFFAIFIYRIFSVFGVFSKLLRAGGSLLGIIFISFLGIVAALSQLIVDLISEFDSIPMQLIAVLILIFALILLSAFSRSLEHSFVVMRKKRGERKLRGTVQETKKTAQRAEKTSRANERSEAENTARRKQIEEDEEMEEQARKEMEGASEE